MEMNQLTKMQKDVTEFRKAFGLDLLIDLLTEEEKALHDSLIIEELVELTDAESDLDRLDAIVDSAYVLMGRFVHSASYYRDFYFMEILIKVAEAKGYNFNLAWDIVHASNMSKLCVSLDEARLTQADYDQKGYNVEIIAMENYYIVRNAEDVTLSCGKFVNKGKTLKSINYMQADLTPALTFGMVGRTIVIGNP